MMLTDTLMNFLFEFPGQVPFSAFCENRTLTTSRHITYTHQCPTVETPLNLLSTYILYWCCHCFQYVPLFHMMTSQLFLYVILYSVTRSITFPTLTMTLVQQRSSWKTFCSDRDTFDHRCRQAIYWGLLKPKLLYLFCGPTKALWVSYLDLKR